MSLSKLIPFGYAMLKGPCATRALRKIRSSTCCQIDVATNGKRGSFVVCSGKLVRASWNGKDGEAAWEDFLKIVEKSESLVHLTFYPPPEEVSISEEFETTLVSEETGSEYFSGISVLAIGKQVMAILHRIEALGIDIMDFEINTDGEKSLVKLIVEPKSKKKIKVDRLRELVLEYLSQLGIKDVEVMLE